MSSEIILVIVFTLALLPGLIGVVIPVLPGIPVMFLVTLLFVAIDGLDRLTGANLAILLMLAVGSLVIDYTAGVLGAKYSGASSRAVGFGILGMIVGTFLLPPFGGLIGLFLAVLAVELKTGSYRKAIKAASGSLAGTVLGILANLVIGITFIVLFVLFSIT